MIPRWHIFWGVIFFLAASILFPDTPYFDLLIMLVSSVLIDFDHYAVFVLKTGKIGLFKSFKWHEKELLKEMQERKRGIRKRGHFHLLHTIEFHVLVYLLSYIWVGFFGVFVGMVFHSVCDFVWLIWADRLYRREYWLVNWLRKKV